MYWAARICNELVVAHAASTRTSHLLDGQLDGVAAPGKRSWGEFFQEKSREIGMCAALAASAAGLSGFAERKAEGGMILTLSQDAEYQTRGAERVIDNGGVQGWFAAEYDSFSGVGRSTLYSTAFAYTPSDIALHSHQIVPYLDRNPVFRFGTGSNYNTNRGTVFEINNVITVPGYVNGSSRASIQDLAVAHLAGQLGNFTAPVFANSRPVAGEILTFAGFGILGTPDTGLIGQDGAIRYGVTRATDSLDPLGASSALYIETQTNVFGEFPFANSATRGDTGAVLTNSLNQIVASYTHGSLQPDTGVAAGLDYTRQDAQAFLRDNQSYVTSVPEPSSILLLAACAVGAGFVGRRRRLIGDRSTQLKDDSIASELPHRTSSEFAKVVARKVGLGTVMMRAATRSWGQYFQEKSRELGMGAGLAASAAGLSGFGERQACGEIISTFGTQEAAKARGAAQTAQFGGNAVYVRADYDFPGFGPISNYFSGFLVNSTTLGTAGHTFTGLAQYNPTYSVGLSADYKSPTIEIPLASFEYHPSYGGTTGSGYDLVRGRLAFAAPGVSDIAFWTGPRPAAGTDVLKIGYGLSGTPNGFDFADQGAARGVFSTLSDLAPVLGSSDKYILSITDWNRPDGGRAASKDSGGQTMVWNPSTSRYELAFMQIGGSLDADGPVTEHLIIDSEARGFLTAVPEPSSLLMLAACTVGAGFVRRRRRLIGDRRTREKRI